MGAAAHDSRSGELLNQSYELHELIEPGGVADTYRATDRKRSRTVKVTVLRPEFALQSSVVSGFLQLPKTLTGLRHPNVSQVIAVESDETGIPFVVEEHVEGESLARMAAAFPDGMPLGVAMTVVMPVIEAMAAAHKLGLVHGRLDHEHVVLTKSGGISVPKIVQFGASVARAKPLPAGGERRTAPELRSGKAADVRSDVWALGALLYETLSGEAPAAGGKHEPIGERAPHLPAELATLIERCLAVEPSRRPKQAEEVRAALTLVRERLRAGASPSQIEPRIGKAAGVVQAEPRMRKPAGHDPRAASMPPKAAAPRAPVAPRAPAPPQPAAAAIEYEPPTAEMPMPAVQARAPERAETSHAFAPVAEITFAVAPEAEPEPLPRSEPAPGFDLAFDEAFEPPPAAATPARSQKRERAVGRNTAIGRDVTLPSLSVAKQVAKEVAGLDDAFAATFEGDAEFALNDTARGDSASGAASFELDGTPPPLPPPPAMDAAAARAFGMDATMMQRAPVVAAVSGFGLAETVAEDDEPEMTFEPARSAPAPRASDSVAVKTMSDVAAAFGPIEGADRIGQGETDGAARGREFRKKREQDEAEIDAKRPARKKAKQREEAAATERKSAERPSHASSEPRTRPGEAPIGSRKQLRQGGMPGAKLSEDQVRTLQARVQAGERRKWRVLGSLLMFLFCFLLVFFIPLLYDPTHTKAQQLLGPKLKIALTGLMIVSVCALVRTWVVQVQSKPMMMKPVTLTMKVVTLCVCVLAMTFFLPVGALGPAEVAARTAMPWAAGAFFLSLGIYGLLLGLRETANNMLLGVALVVLYGGGFAAGYRVLTQTVLLKDPRAHAHARPAKVGSVDAASAADALGKYVGGNVKAPDGGADEPMVEQHQVGASEEEDMRAIEQLKSNRKQKSEQFDDLHKNMQKMVK